MDKPNINGFIKWIENNKDEKTVKYRKPRSEIYDKNKKRNLYIEEMTEDEIEEVGYGRWWRNYPIERRIYEKYINIEEKEIPEKYRKFMKKMKEILPQEYKITIKEYLEWIKSHKYEITGIHRRPRTTIIKNKKQLTLEEMTENEKIELKLGNWWNNNINERLIFEKYCYVKIEDVPKEYREIIEIIKSTSIFQKYIEWKENHFDKEAGKYKEPRMVITRDGVKIKLEDMTFEEKEESEIAYIWKFQSYERKMIKKYEEKEIYEIPEIYREMVEKFRKVDEYKQNEYNEIDEEIAKMQLNAISYINRREQDEEEK